MEGEVDYSTFSLAAGGEFVVLPRSEFDRLVAAAEEDAQLVRAADRARDDPARYPAAVVDAILDGASPVAAWRAYRKMTQAELAVAAGVSQTGIARLETRRNGRVGYGRKQTREAIARALQVPSSALEPLVG